MLLLVDSNSQLLYHEGLILQQWVGMLITYLQALTLHLWIGLERIEESLK